MIMSGLEIIEVLVIAFKLLIIGEAIDDTHSRKRK